MVDSVHLRQDSKIVSNAMIRRHNSVLIPNKKESNKWMQEYSGFNLQEMQEMLIANVSSKASNLGINRQGSLQSEAAFSR